MGGVPSIGPSGLRSLRPVVAKRRLISSFTSSGLHLGSKIAISDGLSASNDFTTSTAGDSRVSLVSFLKAYPRILIFLPIRVP